MTKINLTKKQLEIFQKYQTTKQELQEKFKSVTEVETDFITAIFESAGVPLVDGITFDGEAFVLPVNKKESSDDIEVVEAETV